MHNQIPEDFIEEVLARTDLVGLIHSRVPLKRSGKNYSACCPFHKEKTPSFSVSPDKQFYHCFGCGASGNAITFLRDYERMHFVDAVTSLAQSASLEVPRSQSQNGPQKPSTRPLFDILEKAQAYYCEQLKNTAISQRPIQYLKKRQITGSIAKEFAIGYAPQGWDNLKNALIHNSKESQNALDAGLVIQKDEKRIYDRFRDRIMFPIRDQRGRTIAFGGRVLGDDKPKYLNSPESPLFHKSNELYGLYEALQSRQSPKKFIIVEGYIDVIALAQHDLRFAVATLGTATSTTHLERLFRYAPELVFCFDGDDAGRKAAARGLETAIPCLKDGRQIRFLFLPEGEDPDTLIRQEGKELFNARIEKALPITDFLFEHLSQGLDTSTLDGKARLATLALPMLAQQPKGMLKELMLSQLAEHTKIELKTLAEQLLKAEQKKKASTPSPAPPQQDTDNPNPDSQTPDNTHSKYQRRSAKAPQNYRPNEQENGPAQRTAYKTIRLLLQLPEKAQSIQIPEELRELNLTHTNLLINVLECLQNTPNISTAALLGYWHDTPEGSKLASLAAQEFLLCNDSAGLEVNEMIRQLRKLHIAQSVTRQIASDRENNSKDGTKLKALLELKKQLNKEGDEDDKTDDTQAARE
ncbi:MAG: DNA primase [Pseudomonadales bacterium]|nr:DNA primase [Pseudomonadales bacterium]